MIFVFNSVYPMVNRSSQATVSMAEKEEGEHVASPEVAAARAEEQTLAEEDLGEEGGDDEDEAEDGEDGGDEGTEEAPDDESGDNGKN